MSPIEYDLKQLDTHPALLEGMAQAAFGCPATGWKKLGEGFYGVVYHLSLPREPGRAVCKCYRHSGRHRKEAAQLDLLRAHSLLPVPQVYATLQPPAFPMEVLVMQEMPGVNASLLPTSHPRADGFANQMVDNLVHLHQATRPEGFGFGEESYPDWLSCLTPRIQRLHQALHGRLKPIVSAYVLSAADRAVAALPRIFAEPVPRPALIHSDYNLWNILADPVTARITAVIDPIEAGWADPEMDLFHLENAEGGRFALLARYQKRRPPSSLFPIKNAFYWFFDDVRHLNNMGWYEEERFCAFAQRLLKQMDRFGCA